MTDVGFQMGGDVWNVIEESMDPGEGASKAQAILEKVWRIGARAALEAAKGKAVDVPEPFVMVGDIDALMEEISDE